MSEYECRYLFEPVKVDVMKYVKDVFITETVYGETKTRFYPANLKESSYKTEINCEFK